VAQKIYAYDRDRNTGELSLRSKIEAGTGVDKHLQQVKNYMGIKIVHPKEFLQPLGG
jgi:hypothetical protein